MSEGPQERRKPRDFRAAILGHPNDRRLAPPQLP
jgi:hypothetical protein